MPLTVRWGTVTAVHERADGLIRLEVDGTPSVAFTSLTGAIEEGDIVLVNTQARDLGLGSGVGDVVYVNLTRGLRLGAEQGAHVVSLPYTPGQLARRYAEEDVTPAERLDGTPVVCCSLHSQVVPVCAALAGRRVAYVQAGGGALPVSLSDALRALRARNLIGFTVAVAPCFDADLQCVTLASALLVAAARGAEAVVCGIGPGIVGTATRFGHGGLAAADAANTAVALGGRAVVAPRVSFADPRERHQGLSHHTRAVLELCLGPVAVAWPLGLDAPLGITVETVGAGDWETACTKLPLEHMGRGPDEDPWFFASAFAAGRVARQLLG
jgi:hypothetical protein